MDKSFVVEALAFSWEAIALASEGLLADRDVILLAARQHAGALCWAAEGLRSDSAILAAAAAAPNWNVSDDDSS